MQVFDIIYATLFFLANLGALHFFADFIHQTHYQATNKSKSIFVLFDHCFDYSCFFIIYGLILFWIYSILSGLILGLTFFETNIELFDWLVENKSYIFWLLIFSFAYLLITHFIVDFFTSKITSFYFTNQNYHMGFVVIAVDQIIHFAVLLFPLYLVYLYG